jgi:predicted nucleotidyltransferase
MDRAEAIRILQGLQPRLEARGVAHAYLFGSIARDQGHLRSDIDILIAPLQGRRFDLFDLGAVQSILEDAFYGRRVDVVVEPIRRFEIRDAVTRDRVHAF